MVVMFSSKEGEKILSSFSAFSSDLVLLSIVLIPYLVGDIFFELAITPFAFFWLYGFNFLADS